MTCYFQRRVRAWPNPVTQRATFIGLEYLDSHYSSPYIERVHAPDLLKLLQEWEETEPDLQEEYISTTVSRNKKIREVWRFRLHSRDLGTESPCSVCKCVYILGRSQKAG